MLFHHKDIGSSQFKFTYTLHWAAYQIPIDVDSIMQFCNRCAGLSRREITVSFASGPLQLETVTIALDRQVGKVNNYQHHIGQWQGLPCDHDDLTHGVCVLSSLIINVIFLTVT